MSDDTSKEAFETTVSAYASAKTPDERRMYLRAALRKLAHDAELHAKQVELLVVASAAEGQA